MNRFAVAPSSSSSASPELELKFVLPNALAPTLVPWLDACCQRHPEFPDARTSSVYYDTADWRLLNEKANSDYNKRKLRLRWYAAAEGVGDPAFIEAKLKTGANRDKVRVVLPEPGKFWAAEPLESAAFAEALSNLEAEGISEISRMRPAFQIGYRRRRYVHPFSVSTLCLDTDIRIERIDRGRFRHATPTPLPYAVLEQKGPLDRLDPVFQELIGFGIRKSAFSKYQHCFFHLTGLFP